MSLESPDKEFTIDVTGLRYKVKRVRCRECGDPARVGWGIGRTVPSLYSPKAKKLAHYCLDCAKLHKLVVPTSVAAKELGVTVGTVRKRCNNANLAACYDEGGRWWILKPYRKSMELDQLEVPRG